MFFCPELLLKKRHPLFVLWAASTQDGKQLLKYLTTRKTRSLYLPTVVEELLLTVKANYPDSIPRHRSSLENYSLYLSAKLMYGSCVVLRRKAIILMNDASSLINKLRWNEPTKQDDKQVLLRRYKCKKSKRGYAEADTELDITNLLNFDDDVVDDEPLNFPNENQVTTTSSITLNEPEVLTFDDPLPLQFGDEQQPELILNSFQESVPLPNSELSDRPAVQRRSDYASFEEGLLNDALFKSPLEFIPQPEQASYLPPTHQPEQAEGVVEPISVPEAQQGQIAARVEPEVVAEPVSVTEVQQGQIAAGTRMDDLEQPTADLDLSAEPELSVVRGSPKRMTRKRRHMFRDPVIQIPDQVMRKNIENYSSTQRSEWGRSDTLKMVFLNKWFNLRCMKQPGRSGSLNNALRSLYDRHLVTLSVINEPCYEDVQEPEGIEVGVQNDGDLRNETDMHNQTDMVNDVSVPMVNWSVPMTAPGPELSFNEHRGHASDHVEALNGGDFTFGHNTESIIVDSMTPPMSKVPRLTATQDVSEATLSFVLQQEDCRRTFHGENFALFEDPVMDFAADHEEEVQPRSLKRRSISPIVDGLPLKTIRNISLPEPHSSSMFTLQDAPCSDMPEVELSLFMDPIGSHTLNLRSPEIPEGQTVLSESTPLRGPEILGLIPEISNGDQSALNSPPMSRDEVLRKVTTLADGERISIDDLCPVSTSRLKAASMFYDLLVLHKNNQVVLEQARESNDSVGPIHIRI